MGDLHTQLDGGARDPLERLRAGHEAGYARGGDARARHPALLLREPRSRDEAAQRSGDGVGERFRMVLAFQSQTGGVGEVPHGDECGFRITHHVQPAIHRRELYERRAPTALLVIHVGTSEHLDGGVRRADTPPGASTIRLP